MQVTRWYMGDRVEIHGKSKKHDGKVGTIYLITSKANPYRVRVEKDGVNEYVDCRSDQMTRVE